MATFNIGGSTFHIGEISEDSNTQIGGTVQGGMNYTEQPQPQPQNTDDDEN